MKNMFIVKYEKIYRDAGFRFIYTNKCGLKTYVHPQKLFDIIDTNTSCDAEPIFASLNSLISDADVVIDVGANIGIVSMWLAKRAKIVYSFEPDLSNIEFIKQNLILNDISNVIICNYAVSKHAGEALFYSRESFGHHGLQRKHITKIARTEIVAAITLDEFCSKNAIQDVSVLKIDIEGGELDALIGFNDYLSRRKVKMVIFEHAPILLNNDSYSRLAVFDYLTGFGYEIYNLDHHAMSRDDMSEASQGDYYAIIQ